MLPASWHRLIFLIGLFGLGAGMLFGTVPTSIPEMVLLGNWLLEGRFREKWAALRTNNVFWVLGSLFLLHLLGLLYTADLSRGMDDVRIKIPLLLLPLILFSTPAISKREFRSFFGFFLLAVFVSSCCCYLVYLGYGKKKITDIRDASVFMSHIRFSLFIAFSVICCGYFFVTEKNKPLRIVLCLLVAWFLFYLYKFEMATGAICLVLVSFISAGAYAYARISRLLGLAVFLCLVFAACYGVLRFRNDVTLFEPQSSLASNRLLSHSGSGRTYLQDTLFGLAENGNLITININDAELRQEWAKRNSLPYDSLDKKKNNLRFTLLRYLASRGLTKDSTGVSGLSDKEIGFVEMGITNCNYTEASGLKARWRELVWEYTKYRRGENPSGHTFTMRLEFWKTGLYLVGQHPLSGVGTGDAQQAFDKAYAETGSHLDARWHLRSHNQYLAIAVAFGIPGLLLFLFSIAYPAIVLRRSLHLLYWPFLLICLLSFTAEDTLETQSGVTFFAFYNAFFLWLALRKHAGRPA